MLLFKYFHIKSERDEEGERHLKQLVWQTDIVAINLKMLTNAQNDIGDKITMDSSDLKCRKKAKKSRIAAASIHGKQFAYTMSFLSAELRRFDETECYHDSWSQMYTCMAI